MNSTVSNVTPVTLTPLGGTMHNGGVSTDTETGGYYGIHAKVSRERDGWRTTRELPTFFLHANVQGIMSEDGARRIAHDMIATILDLANDTAVEIYVHATHIGG